MSARYSGRRLGRIVVDVWPGDWFVGTDGRVYVFTGLGTWKVVSR